MQLSDYLSGNYLFHGSPVHGVTELAPQQAMNEGELDGSPCVAATPFPDIAIWRAVLKRKPPFQAQSRFSRQGNRLQFAASSSLVSWVADNRLTGSVYVVNRSDFTQYSGMEWRATGVVVPVAEIVVGIHDLPSYEPL